VTLESATGQVRGRIFPNEDGALVYAVEFEGREIIAPSRIGITVNGVDLGGKVVLGEPA